MSFALLDTNHMLMYFKEQIVKEIKKIQKYKEKEIMNEITHNDNSNNNNNINENNNDINQTNKHILSDNSLCFNKNKVTTVGHTLSLNVSNENRITKENNETKTNNNVSPNMLGLIKNYAKNITKVPEIISLTSPKNCENSQFQPKLPTMTTIHYISNNKTTNNICNQNTQLMINNNKNGNKTIDLTLNENECMIMGEINDKNKNGNILFGNPMIDNKINENKNNINTINHSHLQQQSQSQSQNDKIPTICGKRSLIQTNILSFNKNNIITIKSIKI